MWGSPTRGDLDQRPDCLGAVGEHGATYRRHDDVHHEEVDRLVPYDLERLLRLLRIEDGVPTGQECVPSERTLISSFRQRLHELGAAATPAPSQALIRGVGSAYRVAAETPGLRPKDALLRLPLRALFPLALILPAPPPACQPEPRHRAPEEEERGRFRDR
jgi:hypothetical protein